MRTALISGGTGGLGVAVTAELLARGWRCVVPYTRPEGASALSERISDPEQRARLVLVEADLLDQRNVDRATETAETATAPIGAVVNLLGGFDAPGRVHEVPVERFEGQFQRNLRATYMLCAASLPAMLERGTGSIVCVSSRAALRPFPGAAGYLASKAAVLALVDSLASEYTDAGIRVNAIVPSIIDTDANRAAQPHADYSSWVAPSAIAKVIGFLCSQDSWPISGAHIPVYGRA